MKVERRKWKGEWTPTKPGRKAAQSGMTLIELLVVIVILSLVTAAALPVLTPSTTERRIRETSRELNTLISLQKSNAIRTGRPAGIALKRLSSDTNTDGSRNNDRGVCLEVVPVEQPVPYAGFDENSRIRVSIIGGVVRMQLVTRVTDTTTVPSNGLPAGWGADLVPSGVIRVGDIVETLGTRYRITGNDASVYLPGSGNNPTQPVEFNCTPVNDTGQVLNPTHDSQGNPISVDTLGPSPYWTEPAPYKIHRQPVPMAADPLQIPNGIAIDLEASGILGASPFHWTGGGDGGPITPVDSPVFIMFSPDGNVERVQYQFLSSVGILTRQLRPVSSIALLVGRRELIPAPTAQPTGATESELEADKALRNWLNLESRWVVIGSQTGTVTTSENTFVDTANLTYIDFDGNGENTPLNRRRTEIQAAREFVREMRRTGGS